MANAVLGSGKLWPVCFHLQAMSTVGHQVPGSDPANGTRREGAAIQLPSCVPAQPILILGASWYLCTMHRAPPVGHQLGLGELCPAPPEYRGTSAPEGFASHLLLAARRGQETRDEQTCLSIAQLCRVTVLW